VSTKIANGAIAGRSVWQKPRESPFLRRRCRAARLIAMHNGRGRLSLGHSLCVLCIFDLGAHFHRSTPVTSAATPLIRMDRKIMAAIEQRDPKRLAFAFEEGRRK
jgi:hypothetical protein